MQMHASWCSCSLKVPEQTNDETRLSIIVQVEELEEYQKEIGISSRSRNTELGKAKKQTECRYL